MINDYGRNNKQVQNALRQISGEWTPLDLVRNLQRIKFETQNEEIIAKANNWSGDYERGYFNAVRDVLELVDVFMLNAEDKRKVTDALFEVWEDKRTAKENAEATANEIRKRRNAELDELYDETPCLISHDGFLAKEDCHIMWVD